MENSNMKMEVKCFLVSDKVIFMECNALVVELMRQVLSAPLSSLMALYQGNEQSEFPLMSLGKWLSEFNQDGTSTPMVAEPLDISEIMETVMTEFPRGYRKMPNWDGCKTLQCTWCEWQFHPDHHVNYQQVCPQEARLGEHLEFQDVVH